MKLAVILSALTLAWPAAVLAQSHGMTSMGMGGMDNMGMSNSAAAGDIHKAAGTVKKIDTKRSAVTLAHGPVKTLNWPAMTMSFKVKNKAMLGMFAVGKNVNIEFVRENKDYVVTSVK